MDCLGSQRQDPERRIASVFQQLFRRQILKKLVPIDQLIKADIGDDKQVIRLIDGQDDLSTAGGQFELGVCRCDVRQIPAGHGFGRGSRPIDGGLCPDSGNPLHMFGDRQDELRFSQLACFAEEFPAEDLQVRRKVPRRTNLVGRFR